MIYKNSFKKKILNSRIEKIKLPKLIKKNDFNLFKEELVKKINEAYIYRINKIILNNHFTPLIFNKEIILDFLKFKTISRFVLIKKIILLINFFKLFIKIKKKSVKKNNLIIIHDRHSENYFHWITDILPKIFWLKENDYLTNYKILIPSFKNKFQRKTLENLTNRIYYARKNKNLLIRNSLYVSEFHPSGSPRLEYLIKIRDFFLKKFNCNFGNQKIYISRKYSGRRTLQNENKLIYELKKRKFKIVFMEKLTFKKQVIEAAKSKIIISIHGAGLTNLIWMKENSNIIELRDIDDVNLNPYFVLSHKLGLRYNYFETKKITNKHSPHSNCNLDIKEFIKKYDYLLSS